MTNFSALTDNQLANLSNHIDLFYQDQRTKEESFALHSVKQKEQIVQACENVYGDFNEAIESVLNTTFKILLGQWGYGYANPFVQAVVENDLEHAIFYGDVEDQLFLDFYLHAMKNIYEDVLE